MRDFRLYVIIDKQAVKGRDLIVGAYNTASNSSAGKSYVIFGSNTGSFASGTAVDWVGTAADHVHSSNGSGQTLIGGAENDTITSGGGADVLYGGAGNDLFIIGSSMIDALKNPYGSGANTSQLSRIDGGTGFDSIQISGTSTPLDLTLIKNQSASTPDVGSRISNIDKIDLGTGGNSVKLSLSDVLDMSGMNLIHDSNGTASADGNVWSSSTGTALGTSVSRHQLVIYGDSTDSVTVSGFTSTAVGTETMGGHSYDVYNSTNTTTSTYAQLLIEHSITKSFL